MRTYIKNLTKAIGNECNVYGWVDVRRDQGKMVFLDIRDVTGKVQAVVLPSHFDAMNIAQHIRSEWVVKIHAQVNKRPERNINRDVLNGDIELEVLGIFVLNEAITPSFDIATEGYEIGEEVRLEKRYLDLRRARLQKNLRQRSKVMKFVRDELDALNFVEVETPLLTNPTPEGARSYLVPSRLHSGQFYALPQSPQQYKQLLMSGGLERYFQFARCMRDEDTRGDRQPEFTQMDLEMSFVSREQVMRINEELIIRMVHTLFPEKKIQMIPFPIFTYEEAMEEFGTDKPDIRTDKEDKNLLAFCWVIDFPFFEKTATTDNPEAEGEWTFTHNPFSRPKDEHMEWLMNKEFIANILTNQYDLALNGFEIGGGSIRNHNPEALRKVFEIMGYSNERIEKNFGHMLTALGSGTPPHGGIAWGFDRLMMILLNEPNIREVIAFPKNGEGRDLLMQAPSPTTEKSLKELKLKIEGKP